MSIRTGATVLLAVALTATAALGRRPPRWVDVYRDAEYRVAFDRANVTPRPDGGYAVTYQTWHTHGGVDHGHRWNREIVRSELRCAPLGFRTKRIELFLDGGPAVVTKPGDGAAADAPWRAPAAGSADLTAMRAVCRAVGRRA